MLNVNIKRLCSNVFRKRLYTNAAKSNFAPENRVKRFHVISRDKMYDNPNYFRSLKNFDVRHLADMHSKLCMTWVTLSEMTTDIVNMS